VTYSGALFIHKGNLQSIADIEIPLLEFDGVLTDRLRH
jgi:hypothetical protein